jgi:hypothetical protein
MALDCKKVAACLDELDRELFRAADHVDCDKFHKNSQMTAVLILLVRCSSLLRSSLLLFENRASDGFQVVLRAFEEAWYLAVVLRFADQSEKVRRWHDEENGTWSPPLNELKAFANDRGVADPPMGRDYGRLSEVAHPTKSAAMNSVTLCGSRLGMPEADAELEEEYRNEEARFPDALYRVVWAIGDGDDRFIPLHIDRKSLPLSWALVEGDKRLEGPSSVD